MWTKIRLVPGQMFIVCARLCTLHWPDSRFPPLVNGYAEQIWKVPLSWASKMCRHIWKKRWVWDFVYDEKTGCKMEWNCIKCCGIKRKLFPKWVTNILIKCPSARLLPTYQVKKTDQKREGRPNKSGISESSGQKNFSGRSASEHSYSRQNRCYIIQCVSVRSFSSKVSEG